jgi:hypothetical protein
MLEYAGESLCTLTYARDDGPIVDAHLFTASEAQNVVADMTDLGYIFVPMADGTAVIRDGDGLDVVTIREVFTLLYQVQGKHAKES